MLASITALLYGVVGALQPFGPSDVQLLDGPYRRAYDAELAYFRTIDAERLMVPVERNMGGNPVKAQYGGWEAGWGGAALGFWLTAASRYAAQGADDLRGPVERTVARLAALQRDDGYVGRFPAERFAAVWDGSFTLDPIGGEQRAIHGLGLPFYVIDKELAGLLDVHQALGNEQALTVALRLAEWVKRGSDRLSDAQMQRLLQAEQGGMVAALAELAERGHRPELADTARRWRQAALLAPLRAGRDELAGRHANSTVPKIIGESWLEPALAATFWRLVTEHHAYAIGGIGYDEHFLAPDRLPLGSLAAETCATYNLLKLHARLFARDPSAAAADFAERARLNHILASVDPANGQAMYHVSQRPGHLKVYSTPEDSFWCCTTSGWENPTRYGEGVYYQGADELWVCQYLASRLRWEAAGVVLRQDTAFPESERVTLSFERAPDRPLTLHLRAPAWVAPGARADTGDGVDLHASDGWWTVTRTWRAGDRITIRLPMALTAERRPDDPSSVCFRHGPLVLAGALGREAYPASDQVRDQVSLATWPGVEPPELVADSAEPHDLLQALADRPQCYRTLGSLPRQVDLVPFYQLHHERYTLYWRLRSTAESRAAEPERRLRQAAAARPDSAVLDEVRVGEPESERVHGLDGRDTHTGPFWWGDRGLLHWRDAGDGGWFGYRLTPKRPGRLWLGVTYWGNDAGGRWFDVQADGHTIATVRLDHNWGDVLHEELYPLEAVTVDRAAPVAVRFVARPGQMAGGIYAVRLLAAP